MLLVGEMRDIDTIAATLTIAIAVISTREPGRIVGARAGSPLVVGIGADDHFLASDAAALLSVCTNACTDGLSFAAPPPTAFPGWLTTTTAFTVVLPTSIPIASFAMPPPSLRALTDMSVSAIVGTGTRGRWEATTRK